MPGKHVRFSKDTIVHTFPPTTLPPPLPLTYESHSPASTSSLRTPSDHPSPLPSVNSHNKDLAPPMRRVHSTRHSPPPRLHHLLESSPSPELLYDIRLSPAQIVSKRRVVTAEEFSDSAISPRVPSMTIFHKYLPWSIHVKPGGYSRSRGMQYVTVWDVLNAVHSSLRETIRQQDYDDLGNGSKHQSRVKHAYETRYGLHPRSSPGYQSEKMSGVRRIDFLVEYVKFMGLTPYNVEKGEYTLHTNHWAWGGILNRILQAGNSDCALIQGSTKDTTIGHACYSNKTVEHFLIYSHLSIPQCILADVSAS